ncbi:hypothetical protein LINPERHAP1_LOCUS28011 [Linum perenne]
MVDLGVSLVLFICTLFKTCNGAGLLTTFMLFGFLLFFFFVFCCSSSSASSWLEPSERNQNRTEFKLTVGSGSGSSGGVQSSSRNSNIRSKPCHVPCPVFMRPTCRVLNLNPKGNQCIHLLVQGISLFQHFLHFGLVELVHLVELIIQPPKVHKLVLSTFVRGHQERRLVALRPVIVVH